ncbi:DUF3870 domain-containing protein [Marinactinospora thermotolerans]|uniref:DUF3870 domain-containing protein n=1 Tax=Marinactinospora thermotolerans DSM 45154 TaxID=1122192 RepID=A0A1T4MIC4_9ACTN|nr:DUF3870 domain-containing protein [Marinactinospora thermotolerans]SJZ66596.1 protein of unknown function [Marinactinospora thermotolerans DSM 45154]
MQAHDRFRPLLDNPDVVLVSGYARLPDTVAGHSQYERLGVVLAVDLSDGRVVAADTTLLTDLAREFFRCLVEGLSVRTDTAEMVRRVQTRYAGQSGGALATALRRCLETCHQLRASRAGTHEECSRG